MLRPRQCSSERSGEQSTPFADRSDERESENFYIRYIASRPPTISKTESEKSLNSLKFTAGREETFKYAQSISLYYRSP